MIYHPNKEIAVHTWDWKAQPEWDAITSLFNKFNSKVFIKEIETGSDEYAIVLHTEETKDLVDKAYFQMYDWEKGNIPDELNWNEAYQHISDIREAYTKIGISGIFALIDTINPLFIRYSKGERTQELFDAIMSLS